MDHMDSDCEFPLENLPSLVIENIAQHLSSKDLAACCAVSRGVREAFDDGHLWKSRYNSERAKYLLETPCKVQPPFESPEIADSGLRAICEERLAFMAENHLWNNWRQGKYVQEQIWKASNFYFSYSHRHIFNIFLTNDYVISIYPDKIEILDVRCPSLSLAFKPIYVTTFMDTSVKVANDKIIVSYSSSVKVFHLDDSTKEWALKHSFFIDDAELLPDDSMLRADIEFFKFRSHSIIRIVDHFVVGVTDHDSTMHIWNFETGVKLKEELCPIEYAEIHQMIATSSKDLILSVQQMETFESSLLLAYSLPQLNYLPFREIMGRSYIDLYYDYCIIGDYVTVWGDSKLHIYDYKNCQIKLRDYPINYNTLPQPFGSNIVFLEEENLKLFDPSTSLMQTLEDKCGLKEFVDLFSSFLDGEYYEGWDFTKEILEISKCLKVSKQMHASLFDDDRCKLLVNKAMTRYVADTYIWHFW